jgi:hypothetical protein
MSYTENSHKEEEEEEEEEEIDYNDMPFDSISDKCKEFVLKVKLQLYDSVIYEPDLESNEAQNTALVEKYRMYLIKLLKLCKILPYQTNTEEELQEKIMDFPSDTKDSISDLLHFIITFFQSNQYVDTVPYPDYFEAEFRIYPFVRKPTKKNNEIE